MTTPRPEPADPGAQSPTRGLRFIDMIGFVAGFGLAALLARTVWPRSVDLTGPPLVAFALEYLWLGLAMSGPIILGLDPRRPSSLPPARPARTGRLVGQVAIIPRDAPRPVPPPSLVEYSRAEWAWMMIGGYWIALTFFVVPARTTSAPWTIAGLVPVVGVFFLLRLLPRRNPRTGGQPSLGWTHAVGVGLLWTWPLAWVLLYLLGQTL